MTDTTQLTINHILIKSSFPAKNNLRLGKEEGVEGEGGRTEKPQEVDAATAAAVVWMSRCHFSSRYDYTPEIMQSLSEERILTVAAFSASVEKMKLSSSPVRLLNLS